MKIEVIINGQDEMRAAAEFMARLTAIRFPSILDDTPTEKAAKVIEKAKKAKPAPVDTTEEPATPAPVAEEVPISAAEVKTPEVQEVAAPIEVVDPADLQKLASAKSKTAGAEKVRETITQFGAATIRQLDAASLPKLKAALEAL